jgi:hypothetical protein
MAEVFQRGSAVLDYWLAHPEGLTVRPLNARVERAVGPVPFGPAEALVVRKPGGRTRVIAADAIVAVAPASEELYLDDPGGDPVHKRAAALARVALAGGAWLAPRVARQSRRAAVAVYRASRAGGAWLAPRLALGCRRAAAGTAAACHSLAARAASRRAMSGDSPQTWPFESYSKD